MNEAEIIARRVLCPCCGYPTLGEAAAYEICELCNWEDDGQSDADAEQVCGGPNANYSLAEARRNFSLYQVMYHPERDMRITGQDSQIEKETKPLLMTAFDRLKITTDNKDGIASEVLRLENVLRDEMTRQVHEYEDRHRDSK